MSLCALAALLLLTGCQNKVIDNAMLVDPDGPVSFSQDVLPIFMNTCDGSGCHIGESSNGVDLTNYQQVITSFGTEYETLVVLPGDATNSPIVDKIEPQPRFGLRMPDGRGPLSNEQIAWIRAWIDAGALNN